MGNWLPKLEMCDRILDKMLASTKNAVLILGVLFLSLLLGISSAPAYAQSAIVTPRQVVESALILEKLEADFYNRAMLAVENGSLKNIPQVAQDAIVSFGEEDIRHVEDLSAILKTLGGDPDTINLPESPNYKAILGRNPFAKLEDLLLAVQYIEDLGVAAYKGQLPSLLAAGVAAKPVLAGALEIHSVEARHAAGIRFLRQTLLGDNVLPWIRNPSEVIYKENREGTAIPFNWQAFDGYATPDEVQALMVPILGTNQPHSKSTQTGTVRALW